MKFLPLIPTAVLAISMSVCTGIAAAQVTQAAATPYISPDPTLTSTSVGGDSDDQQTNTPLLTIKKRVDEVNVVFAASFPCN